MENKNVSSRFTSKKPGFDHLLILIALATREHKEIPAALNMPDPVIQMYDCQLFHHPKQTGRKTGLEKRNVQSLLQFSNPCYFTSEGVVCWDLIGQRN